MGGHAQFGGEHFGQQPGGQDERGHAQRFRVNAEHDVVIVALPASATSYTSAGSIPPSAQARGQFGQGLLGERGQPGQRAGVHLVALIRVITSAPNGCCWFSAEATATGCR